MLGVKILDGVTVRNDITAESEILAQPLVQPIGTALDRITVVIVIGTHCAEQSGPGDHLPPRINMDVFHLMR